VIDLITQVIDGFIAADRPMPGLWPIVKRFCACRRFWRTRCGDV
jgi:hypothetical protein